MHLILVFLTFTTFAQVSFKFDHELIMTNKTLQEINDFTQKHCPHRINTVEITAMPPQVVALTPGEAGRANNEKWIEINPLVWNTLTASQKKLLILHEWGHILGLNHVQETNQVMSINNLNSPISWQLFIQQVKQKCKKTNT